MNRMKKSLPLLLLLHFLVLSLVAQDPHFSFVASNPLGVNPALTGQINNNNWRLSLSHRQQWANLLGRQGAFRTYSIGFEHRLCLPFKGNYLALGLAVVGDERGDLPLQRLDGSLSMAYIKVLDQNSDQIRYLLLGAEAGFITHRLDINDLSFDEQFDNPDLPSEIEGSSTTSVADWGAGVAVSFAPTERGDWGFQLGFAAKHLNRPNWSLLGIDYGRLGRTINYHFVGHGSFTWMPKQVGVSVQSIYRVQNPHRQLLSNITFLMKAGGGFAFRLGGGYRSARGFEGLRSDAYVFTAGLVYDTFQLTFNYDGGTKTLAGGPQSLELMLNYQFGRSACSNVYCPSF